MHLLRMSVSGQDGRCAAVLIKKIRAPLTSEKEDDLWIDAESVSLRLATSELSKPHPPTSLNWWRGKHVAKRRASERVVLQSTLRPFTPDRDGPTRRGPDATGRDRMGPGHWGASAAACTGNTEPMIHASSQWTHPHYLISLWLALTLKLTFILDWPTSFNLHHYLHTWLYIIYNFIQRCLTLIFVSGFLSLSHALTSSASLWTDVNQLRGHPSLQIWSRESSSQFFKK